MWIPLFHSSSSLLRVLETKNRVSPKNYVKLDVIGEIMRIPFFRSSSSVSRRLGIKNEISPRNYIKYKLDYRTSTAAVIGALKHI